MTCSNTSPPAPALSKRKRPVQFRVARRDFNSQPSLAGSSQLRISRPGPQADALENHASERGERQPGFGWPCLAAMVLALRTPARRRSEPPMANAAPNFARKIRFSVRHFDATEAVSTIFSTPSTRAGLLATTLAFGACQQSGNLTGSGTAAGRETGGAGPSAGGTATAQRDGPGHVAGDHRADRPGRAAHGVAVRRGGAAPAVTGRRGAPRARGERPVDRAAAGGPGARHLRPDRPRRARSRPGSTGRRAAGPPCR